MRILMLDNEFPPLGGGTGVVYYHLLQEFAEYPDVSVDLVTSCRTAVSYETEQFASRITIYKVPVDNKNIHHSTNRELIRYSWRGLWQCQKLLHEYTYNLSFAFAGVPAGVMSYTLKLRHGLPYLVSLQGPDVPGFEARNRSLYPFLETILRQVWRQATVVTAISVGRLIERKGQHHLLRAFTRVGQDLPDFNLELTLAGTGDAESALKTLAERLGILEQVHFAGFIPHHNMPEVYRQADIFVLPSQSEVMSIPLLETLASGLPVVVTDTGGTRELISPDENGRVVGWGDVEGLAQALKLLIQDKALRETMGIAGRKVALRFSWLNVARQYLDSISNL